MDGRPEDFLAESDGSPVSVEDSSGLEGSHLNELKAIILSIDWEINDEIMARFIEQIARLKDIYKDNKVILLFLQILGSTGRYIKAKKAAADPDAIRLLNTIYTGLEKVLLTKGITEAEREKILLVELSTFRNLKERIADRKAATDSTKEMIFPDKTRLVIEGQEKDVGFQEESRGELLRSDMSHMLPHETFTSAIEEIKQVIKAELGALRAELKLSREGE